MSQSVQRRPRPAKGDSGIYNNIGVTYLVMGDEQAAIAEFKTAVKLDPANVPANLNLGYLAVDSGDYALGFKSFTAVASAEPGNIADELGLAVSFAERRTMTVRASSTTRSSPRSDQRSRLLQHATLHRKYTKNFKKANKHLDAYVSPSRVG